MSERVRVVIADDHAPTRAGVRGALERAGMAVCAEAADAASVVEAAIREGPDVCLLDIHMPGNGIAAAREIRSRLPETALVMLTVSASDDDLFAALRAGASGYLLKDTPPDRLPNALKEVLAGEAALPGTLVARLIDEFRHVEPYKRAGLLKRRGVALTKREFEVLELLRQGLTTEEIAGRLFVSPATVRSHVGGVLKKLRVPDRQAAVRLLDQNGA